MMLTQMLIEFSKDQNFEPITQKQFDEWQRGYIFDGLQNLRYGQSFCNHFGITDNILFYTKTNIAEAEQYIRENYIRQ